MCFDFGLWTSIYDVVHWGCQLEYHGVFGHLVGAGPMATGLVGAFRYCGGYRFTFLSEVVQNHMVVLQVFFVPWGRDGSRICKGIYSGEGVSHKKCMYVCQKASFGDSYK